MQITRRSFLAGTAAVAVAPALPLGPPAGPPYMIYDAERCFSLAPGAINWVSDAELAEIQAAYCTFAGAQCSGVGST